MENYCSMCGHKEKPSPKHECKLKSVGRKGLPPQYNQEQSVVFDADALRWFQRIFNYGYDQALKRAARGDHDADSVAGIASAKQAFEKIFRSGYGSEEGATRRWHSRDEAGWSEATCTLLPVGLEFRDDAKRGSDNCFPNIEYRTRGALITALRGFELVEGEDE